MPRLQERFDLSGSNPNQAAARSRSSRKPPQARRDGPAASDEAIEHELLDKVHAAEDFADLKRVLDRYCAFSAHLHHH